jgi:acetyltransferase-like isoleucine patch superfamily enzyme
MNLFKKLQTKSFRFLAKVFIYKVKPHIDEYQISRTNSIARATIPSMGTNVYFNGNIHISDPLCVVIGNNVHVGAGCYWHTDGGLIIGDNTHISRNVTIYTSDHNYEGQCLPYDNSRVYKQVTVERNVWIGMSVSITPGVTIGEGAIIGIGAVVTKDVAAHSIVGNQPIRQLNIRDFAHYDTLNKKLRYGGVNGRLIEKEEQIEFRKTLFELDNNLVFFVGTGRSGSRAIAKILSKHPEISVAHEPKGQLIRLSTEFAHKKITREKLKQEIIKLYKDAGTVATLFYGESDQKFSNLITILNEIFPNAKFVWLIRNAKEAVRSTYSRGWFDDRELGFPFRPELCVKGVYSTNIYSRHRLNAHLIGDMTEAEWRSLSPYGRNCWYWSYWNSIIEQQFAHLPNDKTFILKLEDFGEKIQELSSFIGLSVTNLLNEVDNSATYALRSSESENDNINFSKYCEGLMEKWYN